MFVKPCFKHGLNIDFYTSAPGQMRTREDGGGRFGRGGGG